MLHAHEVLKIIEGGLNNNKTQVTSYANLLASKLEAEGHQRSADSIRRKIGLSGAGGGTFTTASLSNYEPPLPVDKDSRLNLGDISYVAANTIKIQLPDKVQSDVEEFLSFIDKAPLLHDAGVGITPSMLVYGPPGCGKTQLAHYIASQLGLPLLTARCDTLISSLLGSTAKNLRSLFDHAASRPCVLFLDEFDAFAKARDDQHEVGELKRVVVSLLQNIDALPQGTVLIAATNHHSLLDPAVWRRFAYRIQIPLPNKDIRQRLIRQFLGTYAPKSINLLVEITEGMNGAIIRQACESSIRHAVLARKENIDTEKLIIALIHDQYSEIMNNSDLADDEKIVLLRKDNKKLFTVSRLSALFSVSTGKISSITSA